MKNKATKTRRIIAAIETFGEDGELRTELPNGSAYDLLNAILPDMTKRALYVTVNKMCHEKILENETLSSSSDGRFGKRTVAIRIVGKTRPVAARSSKASRYERLIDAITTLANGESKYVSSRGDVYTDLEPFFPSMKRGSLMAMVHQAREAGIIEKSTSKGARRVTWIGIVRKPTATLEERVAILEAQVLTLTDTNDTPPAADEPDITEVTDILDLREKTIMMLRYGGVDGIPKSLAEVAEVFNLTRERIRQIEAIAIKKQRDAGVIA